MEQYLIDVIIIATLLIFAVFGFMTGFTGKILSILSWISSGIITFYTYPLLLPYAHKYIETAWVASVATGASIFLVVLVLFSLVSKKISGAIKKSRIGMLDRNLGILIGIVLGVFFLGTVAIGMRFFINEHDKPQVMTHSKFLPWVEVCADQLCVFLPDMAKKTTPLKKDVSPHKKEKISEQLATLKPVREKKKGETLYTKKERKDLDQLIEKATEA